jgi:EAL domain-containing protein (putative c-di-GMP-specific phosphodiesterase class I)
MQGFLFSRALPVDEIERLLGMPPKKVARAA